MTERFIAKKYFTIRIEVSVELFSQEDFMYVDKYLPYKKNFWLNYRSQCPVVGVETNRIVQSRSDVWTADSSQRSDQNTK